MNERPDTRDTPKLPERRIPLVAWALDDGHRTERLLKVLRAVAKHILVVIAALATAASCFVLAVSVAIRIAGPIPFDLAAVGTVVSDVADALPFVEADGLPAQTVDVGLYVLSAVGIYRTSVALRDRMRSRRGRSTAGKVNDAGRHADGDSAASTPPRNDQGCRTWPWAVRSRARLRRSQEQ